MLSGIELRDNLQTWMRSVATKWQGNTLELVLGRLGWIESETLTLAQMGDLLGMTRQGAHELVQRFLETLPPLEETVRTTIAHCVDRIVGLGVPIRLERADVLVDDLLGDARPSTSSIVSIARALGVDTRLELVGGYFVASGERPPVVGRLVEEIRRSTQVMGVLNSTRLGTDFTLPPGLSPEDLDIELKFTNWYRHLSGVFYFHGGEGRPSRLTTNARKMLSVTSPMTIEVLAGGLERQRRAGRLDQVPPDWVLSAYFDKQPTFIVMGNLVETTESISVEDALGKVELFLFQALQRQSLSSASLSDLAENAGIPKRTISHFLTYSPVIERNGTHLWGLRGRGPTPKSIAPGAGPVTHSWDSDGRLRIETFVETGGGFVVTVPTAVRPMLDHRTFSDHFGQAVPVAGGKLILKAEQYSSRWIGGWMPMLFDLFQMTLTIGDPDAPRTSDE